ncbi:hypothetical protein BOO29_19145 [Vibrio navarrensis]|uniref:Uncharacterized protein n=1 Tax=Vibrio navarrensis TaxID=29495 RepID=A0A099LWE1_9VIBR|nr:hypothetical protein EA26_14325 [Vibrio navarrensis]MBE4583342.1 hypothetical protein [Vibrio navarrensis]MBE4587006.1 hypothetical protein [Vibrio navarrensis]MBE4617040.1 hypothetical protein [Vibrio navarrensis]
MIAAYFFFPWRLVPVSRQISIVCQREFRAVASVEFWDCARLANLAQSRFGNFAFALSSPKMNFQNLLVSKQMNGYKV